MQTLLFTILIIVSFKAIGQCEEKEFLGPDHKLVYLLKLTADTTDSSQIEQDFFCAFPNTVNELAEIFGIDKQTGMLPFNGVHDRLKIIFFFYNLNKIDKAAYYKKYVDIYSGGEWCYSEHGDGLGLSLKLLADPLNVVAELERRTDSDLQNIFRLMLSCSNELDLKNKFTEINAALATSAPSLMAPLYHVFDDIQSSKPWEKN